MFNQIGQSGDLVRTGRLGDQSLKLVVWALTKMVIRRRGRQLVMLDQIGKIGDLVKTGRFGTSL